MPVVLERVCLAHLWDPCCWSLCVDQRETISVFRVLLLESNIPFAWGTLAWSRFLRGWWFLSCQLVLLIVSQLLALVVSNWVALAAFLSSRGRFPRVLPWQLLELALFRESRGAVLRWTGLMGAGLKWRWLRWCIACLGLQISQLL